MFGDTIVALNKGATVAELNDKLAQVVAAVRASAKSGAITLTLKITPVPKGTRRCKNFKNKKPFNAINKKNTY